MSTIPTRADLAPDRGIDPPSQAKGIRFEHGSVLGGKTRAARVSSQWKSTTATPSSASMRTGSIYCLSIAYLTEVKAQSHQPGILSPQAGEPEGAEVRSKEAAAINGAKRGQRGIARASAPHAGVEAGRQLRDAVPRVAHAEWKGHSDRADPIEQLQASDPERISELLPVRYGRMLVSPFTFFRGSAGVMAADLASMPTTGVRVQACGDCHLLNFGGFATPERNIIFDINDFDETLPAPWEWDVKRLAASFVLAARSNESQ